MLIRFTVSNFLSFKDETEFNMLTGEVKRHPHHVYKREHIDVLRAAAIYGANGAGKSNLIKAIAFLKSLIEGDDLLKPYEKFKLSKESLNKNSQLEIEVELNGVVYDYGIVFNHQIIVEEWLYKVNFDTEDEMIFERKTDENLKHYLKLADKYLKTERDKYFVEFYEKELISPFRAFVSSIRENTFKEIDNFENSFVNELDIYTPNTRSYDLFAMMLLRNDLTKINDILKLFDTGVTRLNSSKMRLTENELNDKFKKQKTELINGALVAPFFHNKKIAFLSIGQEDGAYYLLEISSIHIDSDGNEVEFDLEMESDGTIKLLDFISILIHISESDSIFIIDEIDRSIHPSLLKTFMKILMDMKETKGQIIFTTHESNLLDLDIFRQDEIWFAEKIKKEQHNFTLYQILNLAMI